MLQWREKDTQIHVIPSQVHTATRCNALQHTVIHCNTHHQVKCRHAVGHRETGKSCTHDPVKYTVQHTATHCNAQTGKSSIRYQVKCTLNHTATRRNTLQHTATHCHILQHTATHCNTLQHTATHCNALQHTATHCNALQRTATHRNTHYQVKCRHAVGHRETGKSLNFVNLHCRH